MGQFIHEASSDSVTGLSALASRGRSLPHTETLTCFTDTLMGATPGGMSEEGAATGRRTQGMTPTPQ